MLPVYYDITPEEVAGRYPPMVNFVGVPMSAGIDTVVDKLCKVIHHPGTSLLERIRVQTHDERFRLVAFVTILLVLLGGVSYALFSNMGQRPSTERIDKEIAARVAALQYIADQRLHDFVGVFQRKPAMASAAVSLYQRFWNTKSHYRNEYSLVLPGREIHGRRNVEMKLLQPMHEFTPANNYHMSGLQVYLDSASYMYYNTTPVSYTTTHIGYKNDHYEVTVVYAEGVRLVYTTLDFPTSEKDIRKNHVTINALPPTETYSFIQKGEMWELQEIR